MLLGIVEGGRCCVNTRRWHSRQNYIETTFNIMRRMADWDFGRAAT